jgi:hypothetical protein
LIAKEVGLELEQKIKQGILGFSEGVSEESG